MSQTALTQKVRDMIDADALDHALLTDMFAAHPRYEEKCAGRAVTGWRVVDGRRGIAVVFADGSSDTVSWKKMIKARC